MRGRVSVRVHLNGTDEFEVPADVRQPHSLLLHGKTIKNRAVRHVRLLQGIRLFSSVWWMTWNSLYSVPCGCLLAISSQSAECLFWVFGKYQLLLAYLTEKALREQTFWTRLVMTAGSTERFSAACGAKPPALFFHHHFGSVVLLQVEFFLLCVFIMVWNSLYTAFRSCPVPFGHLFMSVERDP